jgi:hypothetical protein
MSLCANIHMDNCMIVHIKHLGDYPIHEANRQPEEMGLRKIAHKSWRFYVIDKRVFMLSVLKYNILWFEDVL